MPQSDAIAMRICAAVDALLMDISRLRCISSVDSTWMRNFCFAQFEQQGISFYTVWMASLGRALDCALAKDQPLQIPPDCEVRDGLPRFLWPVWKDVFDASGTLLVEPDPAAVRALRQVFYLSYRLELGYSVEQIAEKVTEHVSLDATLFDRDDMLEHLSPRTLRALELARVLISRLFEGSIRVKHESGELKYVDFDPSNIVPRHGPGAVADGVRPHRKYEWKTYYEELAKEYPYEDYFFFNYSHLVDRLHRFLRLPHRDAGFAKLVAVEKDSRGPRLISMEPLEYQWIQQGLGRAMVDWIERHPVTRDRVRFTDQQVNRDLALASSLDQQFDTLDLKDASDRVSLALVRRLFPPFLLSKLEGCRSVGTKVQGNRFVYKKFAPMGSALCFPVESIVFWALAVAAINLETFTWTSHCLRAVSKTQVHVFGDDLVVPHGALDMLRPVFEELLLKFNENKCCTGKFFRESCGCDAFQGVDVTPLRLHHLGDTPNDTVSICSYANAANRRGLHLLSNVLFGIVEARVGTLPSSSSGVAEMHHHVDDWFEAHLRTIRCCKVRLNADLHRLEYRCVMPQSPSKRRNVPDWQEFFRCFPDQETARVSLLFHGSVLKQQAAKDYPWSPRRVPPVPYVYTALRDITLVNRWREFD